MTAIALRDGLYNAGVLGFCRVLEYISAHNPELLGRELYQKCGSTIEFDGETIWPIFTQSYFDTLLHYFQKTTSGYELMQRIESILQPRASEEDGFEDRRKRMMEMLKQKFVTGASYKAACKILEAEGETYPFLDEAKAILKERDWEQQQSRLKIFQTHFEQHRETFYLKDIAYNRVQQYWGGISFLQKTKNTSPFAESFEEEFIQGIQNWKPVKGKRAMTCFQCGAVLPSGMQSMAWINDLGVDIKRKTNGFWNFNVDLIPCPICKLIYACIPLGFLGSAYEGFFINAAGSMEDMISLNQPVNLADPNGEGSFASRLSTFLAQSNVEEAEQRLNNIQVIRRSRNEDGNWQYRVNILSHTMLRGLMDSRSSLKTLRKYPMLLRAVMEDVLDGKHLYPLMIQEERKRLKEKQLVFGLYSVLNVQIKLYTGEDKMENLQNKEKGAKTRTEYLKSKARNAMREGHALREAIMNSVNENKVQSLSYRLLGALQTGNVDTYVQAITRQYLSLGKLVPTVFLDALTDDEVFMAVGQAFLIGLNSIDSKNNTTDTQNGEE